jgi:hypothetical protein
MINSANKPPATRLTPEQQAQHDIEVLSEDLKAFKLIAFVLGIAGVVMALELLTMRDMIAGIC